MGWWVGTILDYQTVMLPLLRFAADKRSESQDVAAPVRFSL
jgi:hypothetical protein